MIPTLPTSLARSSTAAVLTPEGEPAAPAPRSPRPSYDLDLSKMEDEALVVLAAECTYTPAVNALIERYHEWMNRRIAMLGRSRNLPGADIQDAQQEAVFALRSAITSYDVRRRGTPRGCSFRTFLRLVLVARFSNFVKSLRRAGRRFGRSFDTAETPRSGTDPDQGEPWGGHEPETNEGNPANVAERKEFLSRFHEALGRCDDIDRRLWEGLSAGRGLRTVADDLGLSYDQAKRQRRRLLAQLKGKLKELAD